MENIHHDELIRILSYDKGTGVFYWKEPRPKIRVGMKAGSVHHRGYINIEIYGKHYAAHRLAWFYETKFWPADQIDHIDRDKTNNRIENLRQATNSQNRANSSNSNKNGFKGVSFKHWLKKNPYQAQITFQKKVIYLGCFATPEEAHRAYSIKAKELHGEFSRP